MKKFLAFLLPLYRRLPCFRGKYRIGYALFKSLLENAVPIEVSAKQNITYHLPNSIENIGKEIMVKGVYEQESINAITACLRKKVRPIFFDIGANIGAISIPVKKKVPAVKIYAFEASPATFHFLQRNFAANRLPSEELQNKIVYSVSGMEIPFFDAEQYGKSSLAPVYTDKSILVPSISLDDYCNQENITKVDLVKVDVQGFEVDVFKGMNQLLRQKRVSAIFFEFEDWAEKAAGFQPGTSQEFLLNAGYEIFDEKQRKLNGPARKGSVMLWAKPLE